MFAPVILGLLLTLGPYHGPALNGSVAGTTKFMVDVDGKAGQTVQLRALSVPKGYIASFCTNVVCAPFEVRFVLPKSGRERIELQYIENESGSPRPRTVIVAANDAARASIAFALGNRK